MGTTAKGIPYPEGTEYVMDGDDAMQALAEAVDSLLPQSAGGGLTLSGDADNIRTSVVTLPVGRFTSTPAVMLTQNTGVSAASNTNTELWVTSRSAASFQANCSRSNATPVSISWLALAPGAGPLAAPAPLGEDVMVDPVYSTATCHVIGCPNRGDGIDIVTSYTDADGLHYDVTQVWCGGCNHPISDVVADDEGPVTP